MRKLTEKLAENVINESLYENTISILDKCNDNKKFFRDLKFKPTEIKFDYTWNSHYNAYWFFKDNIKCLRKVVADGKHKFSQDVTR